MASAWLGAYAQDNFWSGFKHQKDTVVLLLSMSNYLRKLYIHGTFGTRISIFFHMLHSNKQKAVSLKLE